MPAPFDMELICMKKHIKYISAAVSLLLMYSAGCVQADNSSSSLTESTAISESDSSSESTADTESDTIRDAETDTDSNTDSAEDTDAQTDSNIQKQQSITADKTDIKLTVGESTSVTAKTSPVEDELVWECSDENIAIADSLGNISAIGEGKCVVTVRAKSDSNIVQSIKVTVIGKKSTSSQSSQTSPTQTTITYLESDEGQSMLAQENMGKSKVQSITPSVDNITVALGQTAQITATVTPINADSFDLTWSSSNDFIAQVDSSGLITANEEGTCTIKVTSVSNPDVSANIDVTVTKPAVSEISDNPELPRQELYIDGILIVNKTYSLPKDYNPGGLTGECAAAFEQLRQGAAEDGINIYLSSGFRSYKTQAQLYNGYVYYYGQAAADTFSARPGHSEHQTGLAIDCNIISDAFIGTPEAEWLAEHCHEYGFIIRYPQGKESITGYKYEPWHIRYIGADNAQRIYESGLTLEEYYGISSSYDY